MDAFERLASVIPRYEHREEQLALARAVERSLAGEEHLLAQAGTGTGKSLAYLIPALQSGRRVVGHGDEGASGATAHQGRAACRGGTGRKVRVAVVKGRQNYLCRRRVEAVQLNGLGLLGDEDAYERLLPWIETTRTGDRAELDAEPTPALWSELAVGSDRCLGRRCPRVTTCFAEHARARAAQADLVIANHALYFADLALRERRRARVLPDHDAVVFDEAHKRGDGGELARRPDHRRGRAPPGDRRRLPPPMLGCGFRRGPRPASRPRSRTCCTRSPATGRLRLRMLPQERARPDRRAGADHVQAVGAE